MRGYQRLLSCLLALLVVLLNCAPPAFAFKTPVKGLVGANVHRKIAEEGLVPLGFQKEAMDVIDEGMASQDDFIKDDFTNPKFWSSPDHHCDDNQIKQGQWYFQSRWQEAFDFSKDCFVNKENLQHVRYCLGEGLHTLQDFYSHTNWIELQLQAGKSTPPIYPWSFSLPAKLKSGYFTDAEYYAIRREYIPAPVMSMAARSIKSSLPDDYKSMFVEVARRPEMMAEAKKKYPTANFESQAKFNERMHTLVLTKALDYAINSKDVTHFELNKDDEHSVQGMIRAASGKTLHEIAAECAAKDTSEQWRKFEDKVWDDPSLCAALILPAIKGQKLPSLTIRLEPNAKQSLNQPIEGRSVLRMVDPPASSQREAPVRVKFWLRESGPRGQQVGDERVRVVPLRETYLFNLKDLDIKLPSVTGSYDLYASATFVNEPFQPVTTHVTIGGNSELVIDDARAAPNPQIAGSPMELSLKFHTAGNVIKSVVPSGYIESEDRTFKETISPAAIRQSPDGTWPEAKHTFQPPSEGKYIWHYVLSSAHSGDVNGELELRALKQEKDKGIEVKSEAVINPTGTVGDTFTLRVVYRVSGLSASKSWVDAKETAEVVGQNIGTVPFPLRTRRINFQDGDVVKELTFKSDKPGIFDWRYNIDAPGFGTRQGSVSFIVKPKGASGKLVVDSANVTPTQGVIGDTFTMRVRYHIDGLAAGDTVDAEDSGAVSGPQSASFSVRKTQVRGSGIVERTYTFVPNSKGDYDWNYLLNAGRFGSADNNATPIRFSVRGRSAKSIELIGASVQPPTGSPGAAFRLRVTYRVLGLTAGESVEVTENDKVVGWKTTYNGGRNVVVTAERPTITKEQVFTGAEPGTYAWHYSMDAVGCESLYGAVPFQIVDNTPKPRLSARLEYPQITLAPGETKNCTLYIRGYRGNTADRVEVVFPQMRDGWGNLPGQIQVFPGNTAMDPYNMRGAGDFTAAYALGEGYRAKETAPPGTTPVEIIVRQKDAGEVKVTLLVTVVKRGQATTGTESSSGGPRWVEGTADGGAPTLQQGTVDGGGTGGAVGAGAPTLQQGTSDGAVTGGAVGAGAPTPQQGTSDGAVTGGAVGAGKPSQQGTTAVQQGGAGGSEVTYYFSKAVVAVSPLAGITATGHSPVATGMSPTITEYTSTHVTVPLAWNESSQLLAGIGKQDAKANISYIFPEQITLRAYQSDPTSYTGNGKITCAADAQFTRSGPSSAFNSLPVGIFVADSSSVGPSTDSTRKDSRPSFTTGSANFSLKWDAEPQFAERASMTEGKPVHQPTLELNDTGATMVGIGGNDRAFTAREVAVYKLVYTAAPGTDTGEAPKDDTVKTATLSAHLEKSKIVLEAGKLPSTSNNILIDSWKRDTAEPIEVFYPGQSFHNNLPNDMRVVPGSGTATPDALARLSTDEGLYRWPQGYEALKGAKPGTYRIPITLRQKGAGSVTLELEVQIIPSTNLKFGDSTSMFNKGTAAGAGVWGNGWKPTPVPSTGGSPPEASPTTGSAWSSWKPTSISQGVRPATIPVTPSLPVLPTGPSAVQPPSLVHPRVVQPSTSVAPPVAKPPNTVHPKTSVSTPRSGAPATGQVTFVRTGPFLEQSGPEVKANKAWKIDLAADHVIYTTWLEGAGGSTYPQSSTISLTIPPERIKVGDQLEMRADMSGDKFAYGSGSWSPDFRWLWLPPSRMQLLSPYDTSLKLHIAEPIEVRDFEKLRREAMAAKPGLQIPESTEHPFLKFSVSYGFPHASVIWRYIPESAATKSNPSTMDLSGKWTGYTTSDFPLTIEHSGNSIKIKGDSIFYDGALKGNVIGGRWNYCGDPDTWGMFEVTVDANGKSMTGWYNVEASRTRWPAGNSRQPLKIYR